MRHLFSDVHSERSFTRSKIQNVLRIPVKRTLEQRIAALGVEDKIDQVRVIEDLELLLIRGTIVVLVAAGGVAAAVFHVALVGL